MKEYESLALAILAQAYRDCSRIVRIENNRTKDGLYRDICNVEMALDALEWMSSYECEMVCESLGYSYEKVRSYAAKEQSRWMSVLANLHTCLAVQDLKRGRITGLRNITGL